MIFSKVFLISEIQVLGDIACFIISLYLAFSTKEKHRIFFVLNFVSFFVETFCDVYYDYAFRIMHFAITNSVGLAITLPVLLFQLCQAFNWYSLINKKTILMSPYNFPYFIFAGVVSLVLIFYFFTAQTLSLETICYQSISILLDMMIWIFSIICLSRASSMPIVLLAFGCLMIISADLTARCLFMLEINEVASTGWVHLVWTTGVLVMASGFVSSIKNKKFEFCHPRSLQVVFSTWISSISLIVFMIGFFFLFFLKLNRTQDDLHLMLWNFPILLMFIMIFSVLVGNWFSQFVLIPIKGALDKIQLFNSKNKTNHIFTKLTGIYEFDSLNVLSTRLDEEIKMSRQVAHDIRSPLSSLEVLIKRLPDLEEKKYILLRDAVGHIRDIANNLEKNDAVEKNVDRRSLTQIAVLLDYVISDRRAAFSDQFVEVLHDFQAGAYRYFVDVVPSEMKRILTNLINNACEAMTSEKNTVTVLLEQNTEKLIITICDRGIGISKEVVSTLFKRGFTTKEKGSGFGLSHAKENLEMWGGTIELAPNPTRGVSVHIELPLKCPPSWFVN